MGYMVRWKVEFVVDNNSYEYEGGSDPLDLRAGPDWQRGEGIIPYET